ncbi:uncharacterized protein V6R79_013988 [Siganus canaliculatus]
MINHISCSISGRTEQGTRRQLQQQQQQLQRRGNRATAARDGDRGNGSGGNGSGGFCCGPATAPHLYPVIISRVRTLCAADGSMVTFPTDPKKLETDREITRNTLTVGQAASRTDSPTLPLSSVLSAHQRGGPSIMTRHTPRWQLMLP